MSTLLLRLAGPLQSWGSSAKFERRGTERLPTKSGIIGMVAAALGRRRNEDVNDLLELRFGVRVDRDGKLLRDFHTARRDRLAYVTYRHYLADAIFLVGLEGTHEKLSMIDEALHHPAFPLFMGRRSCPPEGRLSLGIRRDKPLLEALQDEPMLIHDRAVGSVRLVYDAGEEERFTYTQRDIPLSYASENRKYGFRLVSEATCAKVPLEKWNHSGPGTDHDPFMEWRE